MADYIQYDSDDENVSILVEVEKGAVSEQKGVQKATSILKKAGDTIAAVRVSFEETLQQMMQKNANAFIQSVSQLPVLPSEASFTFGLKATGEGGMAVAKVTGEANYTITLTWKREAKPQQDKQETKAAQQDKA